MKLSAKQATMLIEILRATLAIGNLSTYNSKTRQDLYNEIVNQQNNELIDLDKK